VSGGEDIISSTKGRGCQTSCRNTGMIVHFIFLGHWAWSWMCCHTVNHTWPISTATVYWPALISHLTDGTRLSWPGCKLVSWSLTSFFSTNMAISSGRIKKKSSEGQQKLRRHRRQDFDAEGVEDAPKARSRSAIGAKGVRSGDGMSHSPVGVGSGERAVPLPRKCLRNIIDFLASSVPLPPKNCLWWQLSTENGSRFPSTYNKMGVMDAWSRRRFWEFFAFLAKDHLRQNLHNSVPKVFIATPIDMLCAKFVKFGLRKISDIVHCLPDKKTKFLLALQLLILHWSHPKSARASPREWRSASDFIQLQPNAWTPPNVP